MGAASEDLDAFVSALERTDEKEARTRTAETAVVALYYAEKCAVSRSDEYCESDLFQGQLDRYPKSYQIAYGATKNQRQIGPAIKKHLTKLYGDLTRAGADRTATWDFTDIIAEDMLDPQNVRTEIEEAYDLDVQDYLYDPRETGEGTRTPWHVKISEPEELGMAETAPSAAD